MYVPSWLLEERINELTLLMYSFKEWHLLLLVVVRVLLIMLELLLFSA